MPDESDHDALDEKLTRWQQIRKLGILGLEEGLGVFDEVALQRALAVDKRGDDVTRARFFDFENDEVAIADEGTDHGLATHFQGEAFRRARDAQGVHIHGDAFVSMLHHVCRRHAGGNLAEDRNVDDFSAVEVFREDDGTGLMRMALDDAFFFQRTQMTHGGGLAGETEMTLDVTRGGHDAVGTLVAAQVLQEFLLTGREAGIGVGEHEERGLFGRTFPLTPDTQDVFLRQFQRIVTPMLFPNPLKISALLLLAAICHAQEPASLNPSKMEKTGMLPPYTKVLGERAAAAFGKQDWKAARKAYEEMLELDDGNALIWANLGAVEQQSGDVKRAIECFEKSVQINPQLAQTWTALGLLLQKQGDTYRAISCFTRAIHEEPEDARSHNYLAIAAKGLGWTDAAEAELQRAIELKPDYGIAHFNMALMLLERRPPAIELARRHYDKSLALGVAKDEVMERRMKE